MTPFTIARTFDAPPEQVWAAWTTLDALRQWWGPRGFAWLDGTLDLRPGGRFHYGMRGPDGTEMWGLFGYREIVAPERLVFTNGFSDPAGGSVRAWFSTDWPIEVLNTVRFETAGTGTALTLSGAPEAPTAAEAALFGSMHDSMRQGFGGTFDQLAAYLRRDPAAPH